MKQEEDNTVSFGTGLSMVIIFVAGVALVLTIASLIMKAQAEKTPDNLTELKTK